MKVVCISDKMGNPDMYPPVVGETYTVTGLSPCYNDSYYLAEIPLDRNGNKCCYGSKMFAEISDIDETEFVREYNLQTA